MQQQKQFKVGDWVNTTSWQYTTKPAQITEVQNGKYYVQNKNGSGGWLFSASSLLSWQPKEGEYVWNTYKKSLCTIKNIVEDQFGLSFGCYSNMNGISSSGYYRINDLEPFIGELPSFLQK